MRFGAKIGLVLLAVGVLPVALLGLVSYTVSRDELQRTVGRMQTQTAADLALYTERFVSNSIESLRLAVAALPFDELAPNETVQMLSVPYRQLSFVSILAVVNDQGVPIAGPVLERNPDEYPALAGREPVTDADVETFSHRIPRAPPRAGATALGAPYRGAHGPGRIAVALRIGKDRTLAAEIVLRDVESRLAELSRGSGLAYLVDARRRAHRVRTAARAHRRRARPLRGRLLARPVLVAARAPRRRRALALGVRAGEGAALGRGGGAADGGGVQRRRAAPVLHVELGGGGAGPRGGARGGPRADGDPAGAAALARRRGDRGGRLLHAREARGRDEIADLGRAFGRMTAEIRRRDEEIRGWNRELQTRVEERTAELETAQDQILRTRRLAALGSLGAGLAHELNNPMTAITGYLAILKKQLARPAAGGDHRATRRSRRAGWRAWWRTCAASPTRSR